MDHDLPSIVVPVDVTFRDLGLHYDAATRTVSLIRPVLISVIEATKLDPDVVLADDKTQRDLIGAWYRAHIEAGGAPDPLMELVGKYFVGERYVSLESGTFQ
jgi:hypothetical protein